MYRFDYFSKETVLGLARQLNEAGKRPNQGAMQLLHHINDRGTRISGPSMTPILKADSMELGDGNMNLPPMIARAQSIDVDVIILENHCNWLAHSAIKSFQRSGAYLEQMQKALWIRRTNSQCFCFMQSS